jgi:hypothetical protein
VQAGSAGQALLNRRAERVYIFAAAGHISLVFFCFDPPGAAQEAGAGPSLIQTRIEPDR